jgi:hypothetical protein
VLQIYFLHSNEKTGFPNIIWLSDLLNLDSLSFESLDSWVALQNKYESRLFILKFIIDFTTNQLINQASKQPTNQLTKQVTDQPTNPMELTVTQFIKKFPASYGTGSFITMFSKAQHWTLS